jgi:hypothetical protein
VIGEDQAQQAEADSRSDPVGDREVALREKRQRHKGFGLVSPPDDKHDYRATPAAVILGIVTRRRTRPVVALALDQAENNANKPASQG